MNKVKDINDLHDLDDVREYIADRFEVADALVMRVSFLLLIVFYYFDYDDGLIWAMIICGISAGLKVANPFRRNERIF